VRAEGGQVEPLTDGPARYHRWSADGKRIFFLGTGSRANNIWKRSIDTRQERPVTAFAGRRGRMGTWALATDRRFVYFTWVESHGDIWVADIATPSDRRP